mgnify:CR=1 FL=1
MDVLSTIKKRRSVRTFLQRDVEEHKLKTILEYMTLAPSAGNLQAYEIVVVKDKKLMRELSEAAFDQDFIYAAPIAIVIFANPERSSWRYGERGKKLYSIQDATIAGAYLQLVTVHLDLATCWVGAFNDNLVKKILKVPDTWQPIAIFPVGYPAENPTPPKRRRIEDIVHFV